MTIIRISVFDSRTNQKHEMDLPESITGQQIIDAMLKNNKIPRTDNQGNQLAYEIIAGKKGPTGGTRITKKSLKDAGVAAGEQLILHTDIFAA